MVKFIPGVVLLILVSVGASGLAKEITRNQARQLVLKVLQAQGTPTNSPKFDLEDNTGNEKYFPGFYSFDAYFETSNRLATIGHYDVNRRTADVWEGIGCHRLAAPAIKPLQRSLRKRIGLSEHEYQKLSAVAPCSAN
jgi:hypothetical protein